MKNASSNIEIASAPTLTESVRIPLHSLQADLEYLIGRVIADSSCGPMIVKSMRDRLDQIEAYVKAIGTPDAREAAMAEREACAKVADEHAAWAEDKIDSEISIFGTISNAANDVAEMIRHRDDPNWQTHRKALALPAPGQRGEDGK